jgi:signal transduction histidine kinase
MNSGPEPTGLHARIAALETLLRVTRELTAELDREALLTKILRAAMQVSRSSAGSLLLYDAAAQALVFRVVVGGGGDALKDTHVPVTQGIAGEAFSQQRAVVVDDAENDPRYFRAPATSVGMQIHQLLAVPLSARGRAIGVLEVMNQEAGEKYTADDVELLMAFAAQSAIALENARLYGEVLQERDRILAVEAAVRHELARDLHDGPAQMLAVLVMQARIVRDLAKQDPSRIPAEVVSLEATASKALYQTRNILFDLRPLILEQQGLRPALEQYVLRLRMVEPFQIVLDAATLQTRLEPKQEAAIFSIVQEAVNNAKKHAKPDNVWIDARETNTALEIVVRDDGRGFDVAEIQATYATRGSLGLLNMRERAELANGALEITSQPERGTTVTLVVPLSK